MQIVCRVRPPGQFPYLLAPETVHAEKVTHSGERRTLVDRGVGFSERQAPPVSGRGLRFRQAARQECHSSRKRGQAELAGPEAYESMTCGQKSSLSPFPGCPHFQARFSTNGFSGRRCRCAAQSHPVEQPIGPSAELGVSHAHPSHHDGSQPQKTHNLHEEERKAHRDDRVGLNEAHVDQ